MVIAGINDDRRGVWSGDANDNGNSSSRRGDANVVTVGERVARLLQECRREREMISMTNQ